MNVKRLHKLVEILERVPDSQYDDRSWVSKDYQGPISIKNALKKGFVGDAGGWMCQSKYFSKLGLHIDNLNYPKFEGEHGSSAFGKLLGLTEDQTNHMFFNIPTRELVIKYIKLLILDYNISIGE